MIPDRGPHHGATNRFLIHGKELPLKLIIGAFAIGHVPDMQIKVDRSA